MSFGPNTLNPKAQIAINTAERTGLVMKLLYAGHSVAAIARTLGIAENTARAAIKRALDSQMTADVEGWRAVELARLENAHRLVMEKIQAKLDAGDPEDLDLRSVDRLLTIAQRRAKLLGLDMPVKLEIEQGAPTRIIEVASWPTDSSGQALAAPDPGVDEPETNYRDGRGDGVGEDVVRTDLAS